MGHPNCQSTLVHSRTTELFRSRRPLRRFGSMPATPAYPAAHNTTVDAPHVLTWRRDSIQTHCDCQTHVAPLQTRWHVRKTAPPLNTHLGALQTIHITTTAAAPHIHTLATCPHCVPRPSPPNSSRAASPYYSNQPGPALVVPAGTTTLRRRVALHLQGPPQGPVRGAR